MKKALLLVLALALVLSLAACGGKDTPAGTGNSNTPSGNTSTPSDTPQGGTSSTTTPGGTDSTNKPAESGLVSKVGDTASFGTYNGKPVEWQALAVDLTAGKALLITKDAIRLDIFNKTANRENKWADSDVRKWLNDDFYNSIFTSTEQARIIVTNTGVDDKVWILSVDEAKQYFADDAARVASVHLSDTELTETIARYDATLDFDDDPAEVINQKNNKAVTWWLRTPTNIGSAHMVAVVDANGALEEYGYGTDESFHGIRPAIWVDITPETESSLAQENTAPSNGDGTSTDWPDNEFTRLVPKPEIGTLAGNTGGEDRFLATITNVPEADGLNYIAACQNMGWPGDVKGYEGMRGFESVKDGYSLNIAVRGGGMTIQIIRQ